MAKDVCNMTQDKLDALAFDFFREFARSEYCLKAVGYHKPERDAKPDWDALAAELEGVFSNPPDRDLANAVDYFFTTPPKKQVVEDGVLAWDQAGPNSGSRTKDLLILLRRVRNNLFHGGKFNGQWLEPERSEALMRHGLTIIRACIESDEKMREAYHQRAI